MTTMPWARAPVRHRFYAARLIGAMLLRAVSLSLDRLSQRLATMPAYPAPPAEPPLVEFHAEAGAPEGALYVDGQLVGRLRGVTRL